MKSFYLLSIVLFYALGEKLKLTPQELNEYDGRNGKIYLACGGLIFDVTESTAYQKGGSYSGFAGKDATVALAKHSFKPEYLTMRPDEANLTPSHQKAVDSWKEFYTEKYPIVGELVYPAWKEEAL